MKNMRINFKFWLLISAFYMAAIGAFGYLQYQDKQAELLAEIDQKLLAAAQAPRAIIGPDFHDQAVGPDAISKAQDYQLGIKLHQFAKAIDVAYVYSLKRFGDQVLFVVSSATDQELQLDTYEPSYYSSYPEMDDAVLEARNRSNCRIPRSLGAFPFGVFAFQDPGWHTLCDWC